jgi:hypothetical protein
VDEKHDVEKTKSAMIDYYKSFFLITKETELYMPYLTARIELQSELFQLFS